MSNAFLFGKYVLAVTAQENLKLVPITIHELTQLSKDLREFY